MANAIVDVYNWLICRNEINACIVVYERVELSSDMGEKVVPNIYSKSVTQKPPVLYKEIREDLSLAVIAPNILHCLEHKLFELSGSKQLVPNKVTEANHVRSAAQAIAVSPYKLFNYWKRQFLDNCVSIFKAIVCECFGNVLNFFDL